MQDGLNLARIISQAIAISEGVGTGPKLNVSKTLKVYEEEMLERSKEAVLSSREAAEAAMAGEFRPRLVPGVERGINVAV